MIRTRHCSSHILSVVGCILSSGATGTHNLRIQHRESVLLVITRSRMGSAKLMTFRKMDQFLPTAVKSCRMGAEQIPGSFVEVDGDDKGGIRDT